MSDRYKNKSGGVNNGRQRTYAGAYSHDADRNTGKDLGDADFGNVVGGQDKIRSGADHPDLGTYPGPTPNNYVSGDGFKMGKQIYNVGNIDPDGSRALQRDWHQRAGYSGVVSATENERGGTHPERGTDARTDVRSGWGADNKTPGQGSPHGSKFSWQ